MTNGQGHHSREGAGRLLQGSFADFTTPSNFYGPNCLRLLPSLAMPGPPSSLQTTSECPVLLSEVQSLVLNLLGVISGSRRGGKGDPSFVLGG